MSAAQDEFKELMRDKERRTQHPEDDDDDAQSFLNLSDEEDDRTPPASQADLDEDASRASLSSARSTIPLTRYGANTGPKGVISDAQNFRDSRRQHRSSMKSSSTLATQTGGMTLQDRPSTEKLAGSEDEDENDELDDDFMKKWRRSRLREMQKNPANSKMHTRERSRKLWGGLTTVDGEGYLDAVDKSPPDTVVVVYIYDNCSEVSTTIEDCVRSLAKRHLDTRFVKLHYVEAEMEPAGVPALLAYRGGDKFAGLVPVISEIPDDADVSETTLEVLLRRHQILR